MTLKEVKALKKEMTRIKEENEILHQRRAGTKSYGHTCNKKLNQVIEFIDSNKSNHDIYNMCTVLGVVRSTYYKSFYKAKSAREVDNEELKSAIKRIYKEKKGT